jgi:hypothetical protein
MPESNDQLAGLPNEVADPDPYGTIFVGFLDPDSKPGVKIEKRL